MGIEIERKFLVTGDAWRTGARGVFYRQGYLSTAKERTVRVRIAGDRGFLTIKGESSGAARAEYEYEIPAVDAREMLERLCEKPLIEKTRYTVAFAGRKWEIDEFAGENEGLIVAEIEFSGEGVHFELPSWAGREVTGDPRYFNSSLARNPWRNWNTA
ncbi:MAG TPA: CYTH domain-containing protein [Candidatus Ozemobacteraceae bacterium]|nr:CYTH domain-containing protein [Candidatus Ozemobacteraceae bacterium]HQG27215.1 CYTH domain-containing protein [Candidatus Ozemobacteraceae bacterium]